MSGNIDQLAVKELFLDKIAWNMSQQIQQQLTGDMLKWLGGMPDAEGRPTQPVAFVVNYSEYYASIMDQVYGDFVNELSGTGNAGLCSEEERHQVQQAVISYYREQKKEAGDAGEIFSCLDEEAATAAAANETALSKIFKSTINCDGDELCRGFKAQNILAKRQATAVSNERDILMMTQGMKPQRVCRVVNDPDGRPRQSCELVNPPHLAQALVTQRIVVDPSNRLAQIDELDEVIGQFLGQLSNLAVTGIGQLANGSPLTNISGILGLSGNLTVPGGGLSVSIDGGGMLSFVEQLIREDITKLQTTSNTGSITEALAIENDRRKLFERIRGVIAPLEVKIAQSQAEFPGCYDLTLSLSSPSENARKLAEYKTNTDIAIANTDITLPALTNLNQQYNATTDNTRRQSIINAFMEYKPYLGSALENRRLETEGVYDLSTKEQLFRYEMAEKRCACGATNFDTEGIDVIPPGTTASCPID